MAELHDVDASAIVRAEFPEWVEPMAATLTQERFTGADWTFERKFDGIRLVAFKQGADVRLYSRTRRLQHLPVVAAAVAALPPAAGEGPLRRLGRGLARVGSWLDPLG